MMTVSKITTRKAKSKRGYGHLYKRNAAGEEMPFNSRTKGTFWLAFYVDGKRFRRALKAGDGEPITTLREAEKARDVIMAPLVARGKAEQWEAIQAKLAVARTVQTTAEAEASTPLPFGKAWDAFNHSESRPDNSGETTLRNYRAYFTRFERWLAQCHEDVRDIKGVTPEIATEYHRYFKELGHAQNTTNKHFDFLKMMYRAFIADSLCQINPFARIKWKKPRGKRRRELTGDEAALLLGHGEGDIPFLIGIGVFTGLRLGDCATLRWAEIDLRRQLIHRIPNKTSQSDPDKIVKIGIPPLLLARLASIPPTTRGEYVLSTIEQMYNSNAPELSRRIQRHFLNCGIDVHQKGTGKRIKRDKAGLPLRNKDGDIVLQATGNRAVVEVGFHSLRYTYVSLHADRGTPVSVLQENVGHSSPAMTQHYTRVSDQAARHYAGLLESAVAGPVAESVPDWALLKIKKLNGRNWKKIKSELLNHEGEEHE